MMTRVIHKYTIKPGETKTFDLPKYAEYLSAAWHGDTCSMWFLVDPTETQRMACEFRVIGTGWNFDIEEPQNKYPEYKSTCVTPDGYVWHIFLMRRPHGTHS